MQFYDNSQSKTAVMLKEILKEKREIVLIISAYIFLTIIQLFITGTSNDPEFFIINLFLLSFTSALFRINLEVLHNIVFTYLSAVTIAILFNIGSEIYSLLFGNGFSGIIIFYLLYLFFGMVVILPFGIILGSGPNLLMRKLFEKPEEPENRKEYYRISEIESR